MKNVLFLCTANSCRSQMAEGWARNLLGHRLEVFSAGTEPHGIDPLARQVMAEAGVDISAQKSTHVDEVAAIPFDLVVTVCDGARESCPAFPGGGRTLHQPFPDPPALARDAPDIIEALNHYRRVRDRIRTFVSGLGDLFED